MNPTNVKIKMLKTTQGSPDGITVSSFKEDETYLVPYDLAKSFCSSLKVAEVVEDEDEDEDTEDEDTETEDEDGAPEDGAPEEDGELSI